LRGSTSSSNPKAKRVADAVGEADGDFIAVEEDVAAAAGVTAVDTVVDVAAGAGAAITLTTKQMEVNNKCIHSNE